LLNHEHWELRTQWYAAEGSFYQCCRERLMAVLQTPNTIIDRRSAHTAHCPDTAWVSLPQSFRAAAAQSCNAVLLETSRFDSDNRQSHLFLNPKRLLVARRLGEIPGLFGEIEMALKQGLYVAGFLSYECGYHFERFADIEVPQPLAWFGAYEQVHTFNHLLEVNPRGRATPPAGNGTTARYAALADDTALQISEDAYVAQILAIKEHLAAGDTYQVNFTDRLAFSTSLAPAEVFAALSAQQSVAYSAFLNLEDRSILSFSPELFFKIEGERICTRPMKGTMPRGLDLADDERMANRLRSDEKNRSEHVMIVDLLRNDLGRICRIGTVKVESPFVVERYDTLHQMTSTVAGTLLPDIGFYDIFRGLFPSGSITGAPKIRTMQIIRELETHARGVYTGAIGFIAPDRSAVFNVAIRTLAMQDGWLTMGVGGGIVADSDPRDEYRECLLKAAFVTRRHEPFQLIETILWDGDFQLLSLHLDRLASSASYFNFPFERAQITSELFDLPKSHSFANGAPRRIRLLLSENGSRTCEVSEFPQEPSMIRAVLADERTSSTDPFRRHKSTRRELYDRLYAKARAEGFQEVIFANENGELTEGAISNLFVEKEGRFLTPPLSSGVLPGVFRRHILETRAGAVETVLTLDDLKTADAIYLCNSVRGLRQVASIA
jgi:para-aminobenzoate synthetase/4-amino-4-deoxychorismate lyase